MEQEVLGELVVEVDETSWATSQPALAVGPEQIQGRAVEACKDQYLSTQPQGTVAELFQPEPIALSIVYRRKGEKKCILHLLPTPLPGPSPFPSCSSSCATFSSLQDLDLDAVVAVAHGVAGIEKWVSDGQHDVSLKDFCCGFVRARRR